MDPQRDKLISNAAPFGTTDLGGNMSSAVPVDEAGMVTSILKSSRCASRQLVETCPFPIPKPCFDEFYSPVTASIQLIRVIVTQACSSFTCFSGHWHSSPTSWAAGSRLHLSCSLSLPRYFWRLTFGRSRMCRDESLLGCGGGTRFEKTGAISGSTNPSR